MKVKREKGKEVNEREGYWMKKTGMGSYYYKHRFRRGCVDYGSANAMVQESVPESAWL